MRRFLVLLLLIPALSGCADGDPPGAYLPATIRLGVLPDQSAYRLRARYLPLVSYLAAATSLDVELVLSNDYPELLDQFAAGELDIVNFGGLTFTQAEARSGADPLVTRDTDLAFTSCYIVPGPDTRSSIRDFAGEALAFGPRLSTSGHLMPRHFLGLAGIDPEKTFSAVRYSNGHDHTAAWVRDGEVAIGAVNCVILEALLRDRRLEPGEIRVLETTPTYANYVWAVQPSMPEDIRTPLRDAFLALDATVPEQRDLLRSLGANGYLPAARSDFDGIRLAARALGLVERADGK